MSVAVVGTFLLLTVAAALWTIAAALFSRSLLRQRSWTPAQAEIVESSIEAIAGGNTRRRLFRGVYLLRYRAASGIREALVRSGSSSPSRDRIAAKVTAHPAGSTVPIRYLTHAPGQVDTRHRVLAFPLALVLLGLAVAVLAAILWFASQPVDW